MGPLDSLQVVLSPEQSSWLKSFAFTLTIEVPVFVWMARRHRANPASPPVESRSRVTVRRAAAAGAWGTCMTHPVLWFLWPRFYVAALSLLLAPESLREEYGRRAIFFVMDQPHIFWSGVAVAELLIACIEGFTFWLAARRIPLSRAMLTSFLANGASYGLGQLVRHLWPDLL